MRNTKNLIIENVRLQGGPRSAPWVFVQNSDNVAIRNVTLVDANQSGPALVVEDADNTLVDNVVVTGELQPRQGVVYRIRADESFGGLRIRNVVAPDVTDAGISIENLSESGTLDSYAITDNLATVKADLSVERGIVDRNLSVQLNRSQP